MTSPLARACFSDTEFFRLGVPSACSASSARNNHRVVGFRGTSEESPLFENPGASSPSWREDGPTVGSAISLRDSFGWEVRRAEVAKAPRSKSCQTLRE
jgi:hypothetical protein